MADNRVSDLVGMLWSGDLSRREFMLRAAAAGLSASAVTAALTQGAMASPQGGHGLRPARFETPADTMVLADSLVGNQWLTMDPAWFYEINSAAAMNLCYECLYTIPDGAKPTEIVPQLADGMPTASADGLTVTVKLRQDVKFQTSGNGMTANDVIFSWNRLKNIGFQGSFLASDYWTDVKAVDDYTVELTLAAPNAALTAILTSIPLAITDSARVKEMGGTDAVPAEVPTAAAGEDQAKSPEVQANEDARDQINGSTVGTGPYICTSYDKNSEVDFVANDAYWGEAPKLKGFIWINTAEANAQVQQVQVGDADIAYSLPVDQVETVKSDANMQVLTGPTLALCYMALNNAEAKGGPLAKKEVRQAIGYALDYQGYIDGIMGGAAVHPATAVALPLTGTEAVQDKGYTLNLAKAQELWDASGVGDQEITVSYDTDTVAPGGASYETIAVKVKSDLEQIKGCKINLAPAPGTERLAAYRAGDFQATLSPWTPDYPDVDSYTSPFARTGTAAAKRVSFSDPEMDKLLDQG
ncbi:MAG TPA: ABC transporter substrate-binding protein, partial [Thermomicrobiales bacterium]|nr:ABC transporter substrate-binding protein [Thermomicrobiales bacterium]